MATSIYKNVKAYLGGRDISGDLNKVALSYGAELQDDTVFGDTTRSNKAGLKTIGAALEGFVQSDGTDAIEDIIWDKFATADEVLTISPESGAAAEVAFSFKSVLANYSPGGQVGDLYAFSVDANGTGTIYRGTIMETGAKTVTADGTARELGAVSSTQKLYASLHVIAASGTTPTLDVVIQSDDAQGFLSATNRITFAQMTTIGAQLLTADGAITDTWYRAVMTLGGTSPSFTVVIVVGIL